MPAKQKIFIAVPHEEKKPGIVYWFFHGHWLEEKEGYFLSQEELRELLGNAFMEGKLQGEYPSMTPAQSYENAINKIMNP